MQGGSLISIVTRKPNSMPWDKEGKGTSENCYREGYEHTSRSEYEMQVNLVLISQTPFQ